MLTVLAIDADEDAENTEIVYQIYEQNKNRSKESDYIADFFDINSDTGSIHVKTNLSELLGKSVQFFVRASNIQPVRGGLAPNDAVVPVSIQITGDCRYPRKTSFKYEAFVTEDTPVGTKIFELDLAGYSRL